MPVDDTIDKAEYAEQAKRDEALTGYGTKWKAEKGENEIRVIGARPGGKIKYTVGTHWGIWDRGIDKTNGKNLNCPKAVDKTVPCFLCATSAELQDSKNPTDQKIGKEMRVRYAHLYNVLDMENIEAGLQIASFGATVNKAIMALLVSRHFKNIAHSETGHNLVITKTEKNKKIDYSVMAVPEPSPLPDAILDLLDEEDPPDLSKVYAIATDAAMRAAWEGIDDDDDKGPELEKLTSRRRRSEEPAPAPAPVAETSRRAARANATAAVAPAPDDLPFDDVPPPRTRTRAAVVEPEAPDDVDPDDDGGDDPDDGAVAAPAAEPATVGRRLGERAAARRRQ